MKLYIYLDESGTFDKSHNDLFVYGGVMLLGSDVRDGASRMYLGLERAVGRDAGVAPGTEIKASVLPMRGRYRIYKALSRMGCIRFCSIVDQTRVYDDIYISKRRKQCFLDYAAKRGIRHGIESAISLGMIRKEDVTSISMVVDEHSSSTDGRYNLAESIDEELRIGTFNSRWTMQYPPVFSRSLPRVSLAYVDSRTVPMVRAADVTANWVYRAVRDRLQHPAAIQKVASGTSMLWLP